MREPLMEIARRHPEYGYRRTTSELVDQGFAVNHKVVQRLHQHWHLSVLRKVRPPKPNPIGKLLKDDALYKNLEGASREMESLLLDIKLHPSRYRRILSKKEIPYEEPAEDQKN